MVKHLAFGDHGEWAGGAEWEVLHPARDAQYANALDAGMALRVGRGPVSVLYMDSCSERPTRDLAGRGIDVAPDVLVVGTFDDCPEAWMRGWLPATIVHVAGSSLRETRAGAVMPLAYGETATFELP